MATTSTNLTAGKAITGQAGNGKGYKGRAAGLVATAALGVSLLTGMIVSQARQGVQPTAGPAASIAQADGAERQLFLEQNTQLPGPGTLVTQGAEQQLFLEQNLTLPSGGLPGVATTYERLRYLEQNLVLPAGVPMVAVAISERHLFLEQNTQLPTAGTPDFATDQFTYREDHRATSVNPFVPDQFTFREDHRDEIIPQFVADQFTYREDRRAYP